MSPLLRYVTAIVLVVLALGHASFSAANVGFVESMSRDWEVALEALGAAIAAIALGAGALRAAAGRPPWSIVLAGAAVFTLTMAVSVLMGSSDPAMLIVTLFLPAAAAVMWFLERKRRGIAS